VLGVADQAVLLAHGKVQVSGKASEIGEDVLAGAYLGSDMSSEANFPCSNCSSFDVQKKNDGVFCLICGMERSGPKNASETSTMSTPTNTNQERARANPKHQTQETKSQFDPLAEIATHFGVKIWKTMNGTFHLVADDVLDDDRWLFKIDAATDSAIDTGIRSLGLSNFQGRCTWGSKHIHTGVYEPVLIACFGNKDKALLVNLHWKDFWSHEKAVNALSSHLSAQKSHSRELLFMPSIQIWDGEAHGPTGPMGYQFGRSINPSYGLMPIYNSIMGLMSVGRPVVDFSHRNADVGMIRIGQFRPDFFSSNSEGGWFNE
jgi:uncharacterized Zn finger protein (UPF0148 family)